MKKSHYKFLMVLLLLIFTFSTINYAQLVLPQASHGAMVSQKVGITDVTINYSSPGVKNRKIWGGLNIFYIKSDN